MKSTKIIKRITGITLLTGALVTVAVAPLAIINSRENNNISYSNISYKDENAKIDEIIGNVNKHTSITDVTLRKSVLMALKMYRGGDFDFSNTSFFQQNKSVSFSDVANFIKNESLPNLSKFISEFSNIVFNKPFANKFSELLTAKKIIEQDWSKMTNDEINSNIATIKKSMIYEGVDYLYTDFDFFTNASRRDERSISQFLTPEQFWEGISWNDLSGQKYNFDEVKQKINSLSTHEDIENFLLNGPQEPIFHLNLTNKYIIKYEKLVDTSGSKITFQNSGDVVNIEYSMTDAIFGSKNSLYDFDEFAKIYQWTNVISPMLGLKYNFQNLSPVKYQTEHNIISKNTSENTKLYSEPKSLEDILNYEPQDDEMLQSSIPLNTNRYFENKLKQSQTSKHGATMFTAPDPFKESLTKNWYPKIFSGYQTMWQYFNNYLAWGYEFTMPSPEEINTAHKNGVRAFATLFNDEPSSMILRLMSMEENSKMIFVEKLIQILKTRGIDGIFWNSEIGSWATSGISYPTWVKYSKLLHYIDTRFKEEKLLFFQYSNKDIEIPMDGKNKMDWLYSATRNDNTLFTDSMNINRQIYSTPGNGTFSVNHWTPTLDFYDNEFGIGYGKNIFNGFVDKVNVQPGVIGRLNFLKNHPDYTLHTMTWDTNISTQDWINQEWEEMQNMKNNPRSAFYGSTMLDEYYADYAIYGDRHHAWRENYEWSIPEFIARSNIETKNGAKYGITDFFNYEENNVAPTQNSKFDVVVWNNAYNHGKIVQDPRSTTGAVSDYFQEHSTIGSNESFSTSFEFGYGHNFNNNSVNVFNDWANVGSQDILPSYRYIVDKYDSTGKLLTKSINKQVGNRLDKLTISDATAHIMPSSDAYFGSNVLTYEGNLDLNEFIVNKLYVSNITEDKEFSVIVKDLPGTTISLATWKNNSDTFADTPSTKQVDLGNGYKKLFFNVNATSTDKITSFGLKIKNDSATNVDISKILVDGISYNNSSNNNITHTLNNFRAITNNINSNGVIVKFDDSNFDEFTRYFIYDENNKLVTFSPTPYFRIPKDGTYKISIQNSVGEIITEKKINFVKHTFNGGY